MPTAFSNSAPPGVVGVGVGFLLSVGSGEGSALLVAVGVGFFALVGSEEGSGVGAAVAGSVGVLGSVVEGVGCDEEGASWGELDVVAGALLAVGESVEVVGDVASEEGDDASSDVLEGVVPDVVVVVLLEAGVAASPSEPQAVSRDPTRATVRMRETCEVFTESPSCV
ncbi:hypothetical protein [Kytococcus sp. Marseille-QA3725]